MKLSQAKEKYIFTTKIDLGDDEFVTMREPTIDEYQKISAGGEDEDKMMNQLKLIFPKCVVDSSFEDDNGNKATGQQLYDLFSKSSTNFTAIIQDWISSCPFQRQKATKEN